MDKISFCLYCRKAYLRANVCEQCGNDFLLRTNITEEEWCRMSSSDRKKAFLYVSQRVYVTYRMPPDVDYHEDDDVNE